MASNYWTSKIYGFTSVENKADKAEYKFNMQQHQEILAEMALYDKHLSKRAYYSFLRQLPIKHISDYQSIASKSILRKRGIITDLLDGDVYKKYELDQEKLMEGSSVITYFDTLVSLIREAKNNGTCTNIEIYELGILVELIQLMLYSVAVQKWDPYNGYVTINNQSMKMTKIISGLSKKLGHSSQLTDKLLQHLSKYTSQVQLPKGKLEVIWSVGTGHLMAQARGNSWQSCHTAPSLHNDTRGQIWDTGMGTFAWVRHALDYVTSVILIGGTTKPYSTPKNCTPTDVSDELREAIEKEVHYKSRVMMYINTKHKKWAVGTEYPSRNRLGSPEWRHFYNEILKPLMEKKGYKELSLSYQKQGDATGHLGSRNTIADENVQANNRSKTGFLINLDGPLGKGYNDYENKVREVQHGQDDAGTYEDRKYRTIFGDFTYGGDY